MLESIFALVVASSISAEARAQDSSSLPGPLPDEARTQVDRGASALAILAPSRTIQLRANPADLVQAGLVPGPLRGGTVDTASVFYDNGNTDGVGGYSNATIGVFGARRTLLDDFSIGANTLAAISWTHIWASGSQPPFGTGAEFQFRADGSGTPGAVGAVATVTGYTEVATGGVYFSRPEALACATVSPIAFAAGTHWLEGTVVGADNNFWLVRSAVTGAECWMNYDDFGGLFPGSWLIGVQADLNFKLDDSGCPCTPQGCSGSLYDNGPTDGSNGYSNATIGVFGARRTLLDDFDLAGPTDLDGLRWTHVWASGFAPPFGTGAEIFFRADAGGSPGAVSDVAAITSYTEICTGSTFFSRPEAESTAEFGAIQLAPGTHWLEGTVVGADNNLWLIRSSVSGSECWVDYDGWGLLPGSSLFGVQADLNFCLTGSINPLVKYCDPSDGHPNNVATIDASGTSLSGPSITIDLAGGPANQFCYLLIGSSNGIVNQPPGAKGDLCVVGGNCLGRYAKDVGQISGAGTFTTDIGNSASGGPGYGIPTCGGNITRGETWYFQYWHRQPMGQASSFSQALCVLFGN